MRGSTSTSKHTHLHVPSMRELKDWAVNLFSKEKTADAALLVIATMLCGWLLYCLANAFNHSTYLM